MLKVHKSVIVYKSLICFLVRASLYSMLAPLFCYKVTKCVPNKQLHTEMSAHPKINNYLVFCAAPTAMFRPLQAILWEATYKGMRL